MSKIASSGINMGGGSPIPVGQFSSKFKNKSSKKVTKSNRKSSSTVQKIKNKRFSHLSSVQENEDSELVDSNGNDLSEIIDDEIMEEFESPSNKKSSKSPNSKNSPMNRNRNVEQSPGGQRMVPYHKLISKKNSSQLTFQQQNTIKSKKVSTFQPKEDQPGPAAKSQRPSENQFLSVQRHTSPRTTAASQQINSHRSSDNNKNGDRSQFHDSYSSEQSNYFLDQDQINSFLKNDEQIQKGAQEVRLTNIQYNRILLVEFMLCFFAGLSIALSVLLYELRSDPELHDIVEEQWEAPILAYNLFCTISLVLGTYVRYFLYLEWFKGRALLTEYDTLISTGWWQDMGIEMFLMLLAPYPYLNKLTFEEYNDMFRVTLTYTYDDILLCLMFIRVYLFVRWSLISSQFMNPRSKRICTMNGCDANLLFATKAMMKQRPYTTIAIAVSLTIVVFGYQLKVVEGPISEASKQDFTQLSNAMWNVIVTLATVGYGDFYLKTAFGRIVGFIACFWGTFIVSYFVVTVTNMLTFAGPEEKSYTLLLRLHYKEELKRYAVNVLTSAFRHRLARFDHANDENLNLKALRKFRGNMLQFQQAVLQVRNYYDGDSEIDILMRLIDNLRDDVMTLRTEQDQMTENLDKVINFVKRIELLTVEAETRTEDVSGKPIENSFQSITEESQEEERVNW